MDDLLLGLKDLGIGCYWDGFFVGAACYADDVALLTTYSDASGIFHAIATPEFYTLLLACLYSLFNVIISWAASLLSSALSCSSLIVRKVFGESSLLVYTHTGYNAMSGGLHAKQYYQEDGLCATVIPHLRVFGTLKDNDLNGMVNNNNNHTRLSKGCLQSHKVVIWLGVNSNRLSQGCLDQTQGCHTISQYCYIVGS